MMKMDLHVCDSFMNHFRKWFHQRRMIFFFWKEERVSRSVANRVRLASLRDLWPCSTPESHARLRDPQVSSPPSRFVMVRNRYPYALERLGGTLCNLLQPLPDVRRAPDLRIVD